MKIVISAQAPDVTAPFDPRFGRAAHFVVVDTETGAWQAYGNPAAMSGHGAGIEAARFVVDQGAGAVITGATGPNAFRTLHAAGVQVFEAQGGSATDALEAWRRADLPQIDEPTASGHAGMGPGDGQPLGGAGWSSRGGAGRGGSERGRGAGRGGGAPGGGPRSRGRGGGAHGRGGSGARGRG